MLDNQQRFSDQVFSEVELLEKLNVEPKTLSKLRLEKGLPYIRLDTRNRVYLAEEVLGWLKELRRTIS